MFSIALEGTFRVSGFDLHRVEGLGFRTFLELPFCRFILLNKFEGFLKVFLKSLRV